MSERTVLITGAGGFIGSNLVEDQMRRGHAVRALDIDLTGLKRLAPGNGCTLVEGDIRDAGIIADALQGVDTVFHLASAHLEVNKGTDFFRDVNVNALAQLYEMSYAAGVKRFVHCSSVGVYGPIQHLPADESTPCRPDILYEQTKLAGEQAAREILSRVPLSCVILRPAWVYGPRCPRTLKLFRTIRKKRFVMVGKGANLRHPVFIDDMCAGFELAATAQGVEGETLIVAGETAVSLRDLVEQIYSVQGIQPRMPSIPFALMTPVCRAMEYAGQVIGKEPPFSTRSLKFFSESSAFDISRARKALGFCPKVSLREGLERTYQYFLQHDQL